MAVDKAGRWTSSASWDDVRGRGGRLNTFCCWYRRRAKNFQPNLSMIESPCSSNATRREASLYTVFLTKTKAGVSSSDLHDHGQRLLTAAQHKQHEAEESLGTCLLCCYNLRSHNAAHLWKPPVHVCMYQTNPSDVCDDMEGPDPIPGSSEILPLPYLYRSSNLFKVENMRSKSATGGCSKSGPPSPPSSCPCMLQE